MENFTVVVAANSMSCFHLPSSIDPRQESVSMSSVVFTVAVLIRLFFHFLLISPFSESTVRAALSLLMH